MIFNSLTFIFFLVIVCLLYWNLKFNFRIWLIFLSSLCFYGFWKVEFLSVILISTVLDYFIALKLGETPQEEKKRRIRLLLVSLIVNFGLLFYFKYLIFFTDNIFFLAEFIGLEYSKPIINIILPLGISFYTFQTVSYSIDVYRGHTKPIKNFALYGSYVTFFPQLVAGPILRAEEVVSQLKQRAKFKIEFINEGVKRILYGLFLKVVLADNIAPLINDGFNLSVQSLSALDVWVLSFGFGLQIYFDFAGYSHIAIGCAKLMGINFPENFNFPYAANSFRSFWKRWHISLSSWIRDYLYLPLAGIKVINPDLKSTGGLGDSVFKKEISQIKKNKALFYTWAIMGLWHGANWTFVFWGVYHSLMIYFERIIAKISWVKNLGSRRAFLGWCITLPLAMLGWIPFRAESLQDVFIMFGKVINPYQYLYYSIRENTYLVVFVIFIGVMISYLATEYFQKGDYKEGIFFSLIRIVRYAIVFILVFTFFRPISQFIYFQF